MSGVDHGGAARQCDRVLLVSLEDSELLSILVLQTTVTCDALHNTVGSGIYSG